MALGYLLSHRWCFEGNGVACGAMGIRMAALRFDTIAGRALWHPSRSGPLRVFASSRLRVRHRSTGPMSSSVQIGVICGFPIFVRRVGTRRRRGCVVPSGLRHVLRFIPRAMPVGFLISPRRGFEGNGVPVGRWESEGAKMGVRRGVVGWVPPTRRSPFPLRMPDAV